jgi:hypothetical protein
LIGGDSVIKKFWLSPISVVLAGLFFASFLFIGCVTAVSRTQKFQPRVGIEKQFFMASDPKIFPNDVRADLGKYRDKLVSWTGIVLDLRYEEPENQPDSAFWIIKVQHRYYDWLIDFGPQPERYFLSPTGEGEFEVVVGVRRFTGADHEAAIKEVREQFHPGDMIFAYGRPTWVLDDGRVHLDYGFATSIAQHGFGTSAQSYGRIVR